MLPRMLFLCAAVLLSGCGGDAPTTAPPAPPKGDKLPPEVEFDPVTATDKYKSKKSKP